MNANKTNVFSWITGSGDPITATSRIAVTSAIAVILSAGILGYTALYDLFISIEVTPGFFVLTRGASGSKSD